MLTRRNFLLSSSAALALCGASTALFARAARGQFDPVVDRLRQLVDRGALPFASIRIARHGEVLAEAQIPGVEPIGPRSLYRIYSMTKPVVAAATVLLVEEGRLALEDPVAKYVPEFANLKVAGGPPGQLEPAQPMRVAQLLTHSNGLANSWGGASVAPLYREAGLIAAAWMYDPEIGGLDGFAERLGQLPLEFQPGSNWLYGYGLDIAGLVVERISGQRLGEFMKQRIFEPLGMSSTGFFVPPEHSDRLAGLYNARDAGIVRLADGSERAPLRRPLADAGSGGLISTLEDYGRFADMLANGGARSGVRVMAPASARLLTSAYGPQAPLRASLESFGQYASGSVGQALGGITRLDDRSGPGSAGEYAWGGAAGTGFWSTPALGLSVTVMTQLMPVTAVPARDMLRPLVYAAV